MEDTDGITSPIRELRRLYRDAEAKAAPLRRIVDVRTMLDRDPLDASMYAALSAIASFAGANTAIPQRRCAICRRADTRRAA